MRIVTETSEHSICIHHVNMTEDEKLLLKDFENYVVDQTIEHFALELEDSNQFGEHTEAVIDLLYKISNIIRIFFKFNNPFVSAFFFTFHKNWRYGII